MAEADPAVRVIVLTERDAPSAPLAALAGAAAWVQPNWSQLRMFLAIGMLVIGMLHGAVDEHRLLYALFSDLYCIQDDTVATTAFAKPT